MPRVQGDDTAAGSLIRITRDRKNRPAGRCRTRVDGAPRAKGESARIWVARNVAVPGPGRREQGGIVIARQRVQGPVLPKATVNVKPASESSTPTAIK